MLGRGQGINNYLPPGRKIHPLKRAPEDDGPMRSFVEKPRKTVLGKGLDMEP